MKNNKAISQSRQIELLKKYFPVDTDNKIVTVKIYYDKATDMLDFSVGEFKCEIVDNEVLEKITDVIDRIPTDYKVDILFVIDDYCDYNPELLMEKLKDRIEINNYTIVRERKKNWIISSILILVGFCLLFTLGILKQYEILGDGLKRQVLEEMLDITSWVFIWQSVTIMFLSPSELTKISTKLVFKISSVSFCDKEGKELIRNTRNDMMENWELENKVSNIRKSSLLIVSTIITAMGIYEIGSSFLELIEDKWIYSFVISLIGALMILATGLIGFYAYKGSRRAKKLMFPISILVLLYSLVVLFIVSFSSDVALIIRGAIIMVVTLVYSVIGLSQIRKNKRVKQ